MICRRALGGHLIDAAGFTLIRLASGAVDAARDPRRDAPGGCRITFDLVQPAMLFLYATTFSFAYLRLGTGTGALILFGCVQITMILAALRSGERFQPAEGDGLIVALGGLGGLVAPGLTAPSPLGAAAHGGGGRHLGRLLAPGPGRRGRTG